MKYSIYYSILFMLLYWFFVLLGLLHVGDIIKEINGQEVNSPEQMTDVMRKAGQMLTLKILPTLYDNNVQSQVSL